MKEDRSLQIVAHRGASAIYPGNTMAAFLGAIEMGADYIELDVQMTSDREAVICHPEHLFINEERRTIRESTVGEVLGQPTLPITLQILLERLRAVNIGLVIELKNYHLHMDQSFIEDISQLLSMEGRDETSYLVSFDHKLIASSRDCGVKTGLLYVARLTGLAKLIRETGVSFIESPTDLLAMEDIAEAHEAGAVVCGWSTNDIDQMRRLWKMGVDLITTDSPDMAAGLRVEI